MTILIVSHNDDIINDGNNDGNDDNEDNDDEDDVNVSLKSPSLLGWFFRQLA